MVVTDGATTGPAAAKPVPEAAATPQTARATRGCAGDMQGHRNVAPHPHAAQDLEATRRCLFGAFEQAESAHETPCTSCDAGSLPQHRRVDGGHSLCHSSVPAASTRAQQIGDDLGDEDQKSLPNHTTPSRSGGRQRARARRWRQQQQALEEQPVVAPDPMNPEFIVEIVHEGVRMQLGRAEWYRRSLGALRPFPFEALCS